MSRTNDKVGAANSMPDRVIPGDSLLAYLMWVALLPDEVTYRDPVVSANYSTGPSWPYFKISLRAFTSPDLAGKVITHKTLFKLVYEWVAKVAEEIAEQEDVLELGLGLNDLCGIRTEFFELKRDSSVKLQGSHIFHHLAAATNGLPKGDSHPVTQYWSMWAQGTLHTSDRLVRGLLEQVGKELLHRIDHGYLLSDVGQLPVLPPEPLPDAPAPVPVSTLKPLTKVKQHSLLDLLFWTLAAPAHTTYRGHVCITPNLKTRTCQSIKDFAYVKFELCAATGGSDELLSPGGLRNLLLEAIGKYGCHKGVTFEDLNEVKAKCLSPGTGGGKVSGFNSFVNSFIPKPSEVIDTDYYGLFSYYWTYPEGEADLAPLRPLFEGVARCWRSRFNDETMAGSLGMPPMPTLPSDKPEVGTNTGKLPDLPMPAKINENSILHMVLALIWDNKKSKPITLRDCKIYTDLGRHATTLPDVVNVSGMELLEEIIYALFTHISASLAEAFNPSFGTVPPAIDYTYLNSTWISAVGPGDKEAYVPVSSLCQDKATHTTDAFMKDHEKTGRALRALRLVIFKVCKERNLQCAPEPLVGYGGTKPAQSETPTAKAAPVKETPESAVASECPLLLKEVLEGEEFTSKMRETVEELANEFADIIDNKPKGKPSPKKDIDRIKHLYVVMLEYLGSNL